MASEVSREKELMRSLERVRVPRAGHRGSDGRRASLSILAEAIRLDGARETYESERNRRREAALYSDVYSITWNLITREPPSGHNLRSVNPCAGEGSGSSWGCGKGVERPLHGRRMRDRLAAHAITKGGWSEQRRRRSNTSEAPVIARNATYKIATEMRDASLEVLRWDKDDRGAST